MLILLYLAVLGAALYWVSKLLLPEMAKPPIPKPAPRSKTFEIVQSMEADNRVEKLETLLAEKNKNISLLQNEIRIYHVQVRDSDKIKSLLEDEIHRLREQNRIFRSELGLPTVAPKETSIV